MGANFLTVPVTVRKKIVQELLTYSPSQTTPPNTAPSSPLCRLLTLNRQINEEVTQVLNSQLYILIKTNDPRFIKDILNDRDQRLPLISQLRSRDGTINKHVGKAPIALELDFYMFKDDLEATSSAAFLIPASSIKPLLSMLWLPGWSIWCMQACLTFTLLNTFSHTQEAAEKALIQPWINWFVPSHFVGININNAISPILASQLKNRLVGDYAAHGHLKKLDSLTRGVGADMSQAARKITMACKYARVIWDCHLECIRADTGETPGNDSVVALWAMSCRTSANLVQILLTLARNGEQGPEIAIASGDVEILKEARSVAEQWIHFLKDKPTCAHASVGKMVQVETSVRKNKALMCFRVHSVCKGLGDVDAAVAYLVEAIMYEPESEGKLMRMIEALGDEQASIIEKNVSEVVVWAD